jgi:phosphatidylethanolamine/phosphatidyl-N-methylethanolamine N-methyltransferase
LRRKVARIPTHDDGVADAGRHTDRSEALYRRLAPFYDLLYGLSLQPGRRRAIHRLALRKGESVLEIGVGTGLSAVQYPSSCHVVAVDLSAPMLARAKTRLARRTARHVVLCRMDGSRLAFDDETFDAVYAPYLINTVPEPVHVAREMLRVCRPGGRLVFLNHFRRETRGGLLDRVVGRVASRFAGVNWSLELGEFLRDAGLTAASVESVNLPAISSLVVCVKPDRGGAAPRNRTLPV